MVRMLVQFPAAQAKALKAEARRQKKPVAALVRESVDAHLATTRGTAVDKWERARHAVGGFRSGKREIAKNHDKYLAELKSW